MTLLEGPELIGKAYSALAWSLEIFMNYHILTVSCVGQFCLSLAGISRNLSISSEAAGMGFLFLFDWWFEKWLQ